MRQSTENQRNIALVGSTQTPDRRNIAPLFLHEIWAPAYLHYRRKAYNPASRDPEHARALLDQHPLHLLAASLPAWHQTESAFLARTQYCLGAFRRDAASYIKALAGDHYLNYIRGTTRTEGTCRVRPINATEQAALDSITDG